MLKRWMINWVAGKTCDDIPNPEHGHVVSKKVQYGEMVHILCDSGYEVSAPVMCLQNRTLSAMPQCQGTFIAGSHGTTEN